VFYDDYDMCEECYLREKPKKTVEKWEYFYYIYKIMLDSPKNQ
jgi:hypothetical protein